MKFKFNNKFSKLGDEFFAKVHPQPLQSPFLIHMNTPLLQEYNDADGHDDGDLLNGFTGQVSF